MPSRLSRARAAGAGLALAIAAACASPGVPPRTDPAPQPAQDMAEPVSVVPETIVPAVAAARSWEDSVLLSLSLREKAAQMVWQTTFGDYVSEDAPQWRRLKAKAPGLLTTQAAWSTPLKATNRLLVGPFETQRAAQDFVNKLAPKGITAFAWTSPDGQVIAKVAAR